MSHQKGANHIAFSGPPRGPQSEIQRWYKFYTPDKNILIRENFELGLCADDSSLERVYSIFRDTIVQDGLYETPASSHHIFVDQLKRATARKITKEILAITTGIPEEWIGLWAVALVDQALVEPGLFEELPKLSTPGGVQPESPSEDRTYEAPAINNVILLSQMTFAVLCMEYEPPLNVEIATSRCLSDGVYGGHPKNYKLSLLLKEYARRLKELESQLSPPLRIEGGELRWLRIADEADAEIVVVKTQDDFEIAVTHLYNGGRDMKATLNFSFRPAVISRGLGYLLAQKKAKERAREVAQRGKEKSMQGSGSASQIPPRVGQNKQKASSGRNVRGSKQQLVAGKGENTLSSTKSSGSLGPGENTGSTPQEEEVFEEELMDAAVLDAFPLPPSGTPDLSQKLPSTAKSQSKTSQPSSSSQHLDVNPGGLTPDPLRSSPPQSPPGIPDRELRSKVMKVRARMGNSIGVVEARNALTFCNYDIEEAFLFLKGESAARNVAPPGPAAPNRGPSQNSTAPAPGAAKPTTLGAAGNKLGTKRGPRLLSPFSPRPSSLNAVPGAAAAKSQPATPQSLDAQKRTPQKSINKGNQVSKIPQTPDAKKDESPESLTNTKRISLIEAFKKRVSKKPDEEALDEKYDNLYREVRRDAFKAGGDEEAADERMETLGRNPATGLLNGEPVVVVVDEEEEKELDWGSQVLRNLLSMKRLTQILEPEEQVVDKKKWAEYCRLFQISPDKTGVDERVTIAGIRTPLFQYQAYAVYWQMVNSREVGGGFLADTPGLGKTLIFLAFLVVERQLCILWDQITNSREIRDGLHLKISDQGGNDVCPSQHTRPGWIACPCASSSPASRMKKKMGVRIALVPPPLMSNWRKNWRDHIDPTQKELGMQILMAASGTGMSGIPNSQVAGVADNVNKLRAIKAERGDDKAKKDQDRFLLLTTSQSIDKYLAKFEYGGGKRGEYVQTLEGYFDRMTKSQRLKWHTKATKFNINFGIGVADECHEDFYREKGRPGVLARIPGHPFVWGMSGTPFDKTPRALEGILWALECQAAKKDIYSSDSGWKQDTADMERFAWPFISDLGKRFHSIVKSGEKTEENMNNLANKFYTVLSTFMIRRDAENSRWFGHHLMKLKPYLHRDIFLQHNPRYDQEIKALKPYLACQLELGLKAVQEHWDRSRPEKRAGERPTKLGSVNKINLQWKVRMMGTVPYLAKLTAAPHKLTLKMDELNKMRENEKKCPYTQHLDAIFESSPKLLWLRRFIRKLDQTKDINGEEQKVVILTAFAPIAFVIRLVIEKYIPGKRGRVGEISQNLPPSSREAILEAFTDEMLEDPTGKRTRKRKCNYQFLVGTTKLLGSGHQLTRACNIVLMEPDQAFYREIQAYHRVHRIGQENSAVWSYRLIDAGSQIEMEILKTQRIRSEVPGTPVRSAEATQLDLGGDVFIDSEPTMTMIEALRHGSLDGPQVGTDSLGTERDGVEFYDPTSPMLRTPRIRDLPELPVEEDLGIGNDVVESPSVQAERWRALRRSANFFAARTQGNPSEEGHVAERSPPRPATWSGAP